MLSRYRFALAMTTLLFVAGTQMSYAQNLFTFEYAAFAQSKLAEFREGPGLENLEIDISRLDFNIRHSFLLYSDNTRIISGCHISLLDFDFVNWDDPLREYRPDKMYGLSCEFAIQQIISSSWFLKFQGSPGIYSDFHGLKDDDFRMQGSVAFGRNSHGNLEYGFGLARLDILGESDFWPSIYMVWQLNPTNIVRIDFPHHAEYNYIFLDGLEFGAIAEMKGNRYHIDDRSVIDVYENNSVQYSAGTAGLYAKIRVTGNLFGMFQMGYTFRKFLEINDTPDRDHGEFNSQNNFIIKLSLELRPSDILSE